MFFSVLEIFGRRRDRNSVKRWRTEPQTSSLQTSSEPGTQGIPVKAPGIGRAVP